jgi:protein N-terminal amidase
VIHPDLNPYRFQSDFYLCEFAHFQATKQANVIVCCMAWLKSDEETDGSDVIPYWIERLRPLDHSNTVIAICNRLGKETRSFAGHSCVIQFRASDVEVMHGGMMEGVFMLETQAME